MIPLTLLRLSFAAVSDTFQFLSVFCNTLHLLRVPEDYASAVVGKVRAGMSGARCGCAVFPFCADCKDQEVASLPRRLRYLELNGISGKHMAAQGTQARLPVWDDRKGSLNSS